ACGIVGVLYYGSLFRVRASASTTPLLLVGVPLLVVGGGGVPVGAMLGKLLAFFLKADRKSTRLNSSHVAISYAVFCLKKKIPTRTRQRTSTNSTFSSRPRRLSLQPTSVRSTAAVIRTLHRP